MASTAYAWTFGLLTLFGLGVLFIVFSQVLTVHLVPVIQQNIDISDNIEGDTKLEIKGNISNYMNFFNTLPFILFIVVVIYMFVAAIRREGETL
jgi:uncharacterized protein (DUF58 family)